MTTAAATVDCLVVIRLGRGNIAKARSAAHHVDQHRRDFRPRDIR